MRFLRFWNGESPPAMNEALLQPFTLKQISQALKKMHPLKSLGPDEAFSGMIRKAESEWSIQGVVVSRSGPSISHLLFAYDTLIFYQASTEAMLCLRNILFSFGKASGLIINMHKSAMVFIHNVNEGCHMELASMLRVTVLPKHEKYLGLPTVAGRSKRELFEGIKRSYLV
ncbi:UNVERIFIED_CONTAM: hypothetical protein Sradi_0190600 [Sesamum radiatum]|uniref:Reverse transcriptase n=1 Tax=Sesamum radiatum TaxID=300843 RepID=A0AAW2VZN1_SESRA